MTYGSRAEFADAIHGRYRAASAKKLAKLPSYRISPAKKSGFNAMNNAIMRPRAKPVIVPAATPRQSTFCSPFVISHLQGRPPPYHYPRANDQPRLFESASSRQHPPLEPGNRFSDIPNSNPDNHRGRSIRSRNPSSLIPCSSDSVNEAAPAGLRMRSAWNGPVSQHARREPTFNAQTLPRASVPQFSKLRSCPRFRDTVRAALYSVR